MLLLLSLVLITVGTELCLPKALLQSALMKHSLLPCSVASDPCPPLASRERPNVFALDTAHQSQ